MLRLAAIAFGTTALVCGAIRFQLPGTDGIQHGSSGGVAGTKPAVLVFLGTDCPISNRYAPLIHKLEAEYGPKGFEFLAVFSERTATLPVLREHLKRYALDMPGLLDANADLAKQAGATVTPEVAILLPDGDLFYRGRIDDRYVDWGKTRAAAQHHDLQNALDAYLAHRPAESRFTRAFGCAIEGAAQQ